MFSTTHDEMQLSIVSFAWSLPVLLFGLIAGSFADHYDKRKVLIWTQALLGSVAIYLAAATYYGFIAYWQIVLASFATGLISCVEMPTRQSTVSRVVPIEDLPTAVPINAMTFNMARVFGPALGGVLLASFGVPVCYLLNGISFIALIWAAMAIKANLKSHETQPSPMKDIMTEGIRHTFRDRRLRALLILEAVTAVAGIAYMQLMPAYVQDVLHMTEVDGGRIVGSRVVLGYCFTAVGVGAVIALGLVTVMSDRGRKETIIRIAMWLIAIGLAILSVTRSLYVALPVMALMGMATVAQFNTTNALCQLLAPERLRGRVIAVHVWTLNGMAPFGVLFFGWFARQSRLSWDLTKHLSSAGVPLSMQVAAALMLAGAVGATLSRRALTNLG